MRFDFEQQFTLWMEALVSAEVNPRRRELLLKGLGHGSVEFLRQIWFPIVGHFDHLQPEWEVRDFGNGYRYIDFAYLPGGRKGAIEVHGFASHARDLDVRRFKDLCYRQGYLGLDDWTFLPVAYPAIMDEPKHCQQIVLSFIGKFLAVDVHASLDWLEAETVRLARRLLRPFTPDELCAHLRITKQHSRRLLSKLVELKILKVASGTVRYRTYQLIY
ncbi:transcriptional regulator [Paenibacillus swuensis]|uniref:Transcriptional regulator n=1 Tax=Paenibacillus swuensis TaxID=1178515 RepID=A0A172TER7_9BACL|nr:transcriptional regulator [Paenibacillus swuensis]ANE45283.1 transcriptional regulator [Paenibacillus swuensis]